MPLSSLGLQILSPLPTSFSPSLTSCGTVTPGLSLLQEWPVDKAKLGLRLASLGKFIAGSEGCRRLYVALGRFVRTGGL